VDVNAMAGKVTPRTRVVFVANPNSTGTYIPQADVERLRRDLPPQVLLVLDAAYAEFVDAPDYEPGIAMVRATNNTVMTRTFSKAFGLAGVRLGWAYCPPAIAEVLNRLRAPFNVTLPAQRAGIAALDDREFFASVRAHNAKWRPWLEKELAALGLDPVPSVANFVLTRFPGGAAQANAANAHLTARGVLVREMTAYGLGDCLRITVGREDELKALVAGLKDFLAK
jgi:histidinol-phosphate aminotransferase